jgi:SAM-dependent methyltransferase
VFCDLMSFVPLAERKWWAAGQFARHFVLPLAVLGAQGQHARAAFQVSRDGMAPDVARRAMGWHRFLTRFWPMMAGSGGPSTLVVVPDAEGPLSTTDLAAVGKYRRGLHETLSWMVDGVRPRSAPKSAWSRYRDHREHYPEGSVDAKRLFVHQWLSRTAPGWVLDLGCNTGEFSRLAADCGARVVAVDADHDAIQSLYSTLDGGSAIHPLISSLDDMSGGRGWCGSEHPGLMERLRGRFDAVLMLALIHHLIVSSAIPLTAVAAFVRQCTRRLAIVELIDEDDPQMRLLCSQRQRNPKDFGIVLQRQAFLDAGFLIEEEVVLEPGSRRLALLRIAV